jgi:hypothetical protein
LAEIGKLKMASMGFTCQYAPPFKRCRRIRFCAYRSVMEISRADQHVQISNRITMHNDWKLNNAGSFDDCDGFCSAEKLAKITYFPTKLKRANMQARRALFQIHNFQVEQRFVENEFI